MKLCYVNGRFTPPEEAALPLSDLLVQRGVGVFEVIGTYGGRPLLLTPHLERLLNGAERERIRPTLSMEDMKCLVREGLARAGSDVQVKVYLSGGDVFEDVQGFTAPRFFMIFEELSPPPREAYEEGVALEPLPFGRKDPAVKGVDYRTTYALSRSGAFEVLYCPDGEITEAGHSTFFLVLEGRLVTAPLSRVLKGTTRSVILELARAEGVETQERCPRVDELPRASEAFITGSVKKVLPVVRVGEQRIGTGRPGPVAARLLKLYLDRIQNWLE